jgi:molecular chaperone DnaK (HSP70)
MDQKDKSFSQDFETLMALFRKLADKMSNDETAGSNPALSTQFKLMLSQYEMLKHLMPNDIPEQFREPFRKMMETMIVQLKNEVGNDESLTPEKKEESERSIDQIEEMLRKPGLKPEEIDKLLDRLTLLKKG